MSVNLPGKYKREKLGDNWLKTKLKALGNTIKQKNVQMWDEMKTGFKDFLNGTAENIKNWKDDKVEQFTNNYTQLVDGKRKVLVGKMAFDAANGVKNKLNSVNVATADLKNKLDSWRDGQMFNGFGGGISKFVTGAASKILSGAEILTGFTHSKLLAVEDYFKTHKCKIIILTPGQITTPFEWSPKGSTFAFEVNGEDVIQGEVHPKLKKDENALLFAHSSEIPKCENMNFEIIIFKEVPQKIALYLNKTGYDEIHWQWYPKFNGICVQLLSDDGKNFSFVIPKYDIKGVLTNYGFVMTLNRLTKEQREKRSKEPENINWVPNLEQTWKPSIQRTNIAVGPGNTPMTGLHLNMSNNPVAIPSGQITQETLDKLPGF